MKMQSTLSVDMILRRKKTDKTTGLLYSKIFFDSGKPVEASLKQTVTVSQSDWKAEKLRGTTPLAKKNNDYIDNERITIRAR